MTSSPRSLARPLADVHLLITGAGASGKSRIALDLFLKSTRGVMLLPTSTSAEHLRHTLARSGRAVRPSRIVTPEQFADSFGIPAPPTAGLLHLLVADALERLGLRTFEAAADFPGLRRALAARVEEVPRRRIPGPFGEDLSRVFEDVTAQVERRGLAMARDRLSLTAAAILKMANLPFDQVVIDGFFSLESRDLELIQALACRVPVAVTLADNEEFATPRRRLLDLGFQERRLTTVYRTSTRQFLRAPTLERETEEIARRILEYSAHGREFNEIGIVLRSAEPYAPALEATLGRFGIPARFYFARSADSHPWVQFVTGIVRALLSRWPFEKLASLVQMTASGLGGTPEGDRLDFALRNLMPGSGLPVRGLDDPPELFSRFAALDSWLRDRLAAAEWTSRLKTLSRLSAAPPLDVSREEILMWQGVATAKEAFERALDAAAQALDTAGAMPLPAFWTRALIALEVEPLRTVDRRRNVVHVLDVFEARQWELPVVFLCGLTERHFPKYHRQDPLLDDATRRALDMETSADLQQQERLLFDLAASRAAEETVLSWPCFDRGGEALLPSFFLGEETAPLSETRTRQIPRQAPAAMTARFRIFDEGLRERLAGAHKKLSMSKVDTYLQCPFQFFARHTMRLAPSPSTPGDRLNILVQGTLFHRALAEYSKAPLLGIEVLDAVFDEECRRLNVPRTYRTEAIRLELLRNFEAFLAGPRSSSGWDVRIEEPFQFSPNPLLAISGRIDRLETGPNGEALVIDYKYSAGNQIRKRVKEQDQGDGVQGGLYLAAAVQVFGLKPAGMLYCGLKKGTTWDGWHLPGIQGFEGIGESVTADVLRDLMEAALANAVRAQEEIVGGNIQAKPSDTTKCRYCDFKDICRVESAAKSQEAAW